MMKLLFKTIIALGFFISVIPLKVFASHAQGGEVSYTCVAPNVYLINYKLYDDCTGPAAPFSLTIELKPQSCAGGRSIVAMRSGNPIIGNPFCASLSQNCTSRPSHIVINFSTTVTFTPAEAACPNWIISFTENSRPEVANLINPQGSLYCEAYLNLASGINNNSPVINALAPTVEFVCIGQETSLSLTSYDPDCDSLSFELVAPLSASGVSYAYNSLPGVLTGTIVNPNPLPPYNPITNPQTATLPATATNYSPGFPIPGYTINWNQIDPITGQPYPNVQASPNFSLNPATGNILFRPVYFVPSPWVQGKNKYVVVVKINEWRKVNGAVTKVGSTLRDMLFIVEDCGGNSSPTFQTLLANGQQIQSGDTLIVRPGAQLNLQFASFDVDATDTTSIESNVSSELIGSVFTHSVAIQPTGQITWTAPNTNFSCGIRYFYIRVRDSNCPIRGKKVYVIGVKVSNTGTATGIKENLKADLNFIAYPNPFTNEVAFKFDINKQAEEIRIFNLLGQEIDKIKVPVNLAEIPWDNASKFAAGTYVARLITSDNSVQTLKFTKIQ